METLQFCILAALSGASAVIGGILLYKLRSVIYLLEQPVVKKMSPQLKLKPVKVEEGEAEPRRDNRPANGQNQNRGPRPAFERTEGGERPPRDMQNRDRGPRPERVENGAAPVGDRGPRPDRERSDRNDRGDRSDRFRDRGGRHDRNERHSGGMDRGDRDRNRNRSEVFSNDKESAPEGAAPRPVQPHVEANSGAGTLAPRRPLPSTVDHEVTARDIPAADSSGAVENTDALFVRDESDMQHGRRNQLKKKPRFEVNEEEIKATTEETKTI